MNRMYTYVGMAVLSCALVTTIACTPATPAAPAATPGNPVTGPDGSTLKVNAPTPTSPAEGQVVNTTSPTVQVSGASGQYASASLSYQFELQNAGGSAISTQTMNGTSWTPGNLALDTVYRFRARATADGAFGPWSGVRSFRTFSLPGCVNGLLQDPKAYFFWLIGRNEGDLAGDFQFPLRVIGFPNGNPPGVRPTFGPPNYGMTQQISGGTVYRGRLWLPTARPDGLGYYAREVELLTQAGGLRWAWKENNDGPPYDPRPCP